MDKHLKCKKISSVFGCCLLLLPTGVQWYWGNMETYVFSYFHKQSSTVSGSGSRWLTSIFLVVRVIALIASGFVQRFPSKRLPAVVGVVVFNVGMFTSFFAIRHSVAMLNFTLGAVCGAGTGILYGSSLQVSLLWADKDSGLIVSFVQSSYTFGAILIIQFMTLYANPNNLPAIESDEHYAFFDLEDDINRVPFTFLILGACFLIIQLVGLGLIRDCPEKPKDTSASSECITSVTEQTEVNNSSTNNSSPLVNKESPNCSEFTVKKMFRTKAFYVIWTSHFLGNYPYLVLTNDYKSFGQLRIKDDHFMSILGIAIVIVSVVMKIIYGVISDRFGFRIGLIMTFSLMTISIAFMYVSSLVNRWAYFFVVLVLAIPSGTILTSHTIAAVHLFGSRNVVLNTGFMSSAAIVILLAAPPLMGTLLEFGGWCSIFYSGAGFALLSLILIVCFL